jgi:hypothetical protein
MDNLEPSKPNRKKFDMDLKYGKVREKLVAEMLQDKKIEHNASRMYLLNLQKLFSSDVIKTFKGE